MDWRRGGLPRSLRPPTPRRPYSGHPRGASPPAARRATAPCPGHGAPHPDHGKGGIGYDRETWLYRTLGDSALLPSPFLFDFRTDYYAAQSAALRAGLGIGGMQRPIAARYPELVPVLPEAFDVTMEMWLAMHEDLRPVPGVRALFDHLATELQAFCGSDAGLP